MFDQDKLKTLNQLEMDIYEYVITHKEEVASCRIRDLAKKTNVSTSTIMRFCNKLGHSGFTEFKIKFSMFLDDKEKIDVHPDIDLAIANLRRMSASDIDIIISKASHYFNENSTIVFLGLGSSAILCKYAVRYFFSLGILSSYVDDPYYPRNMKFHENSIFIVVSASGDTPDTIQFINNFKKYNGKIISITNYANNTISHLSDINIPYYVHPEYINISNITTQVPVIYILEALAKNVYKRINNIESCDSE